MRYNRDYPVKQGTIKDYSANTKYAIEFPSIVDNSYSYVLYKSVVFLMDSKKEPVSSGGVKNALMIMHMCFFGQNQSLIYCLMNVGMF